MSKNLPQSIHQLLHHGTVIPAHPLALTTDRKLDERYQRALTRYYMDAGAGGVAVAVHTTQFEIRRPEHNMFRRVLELAMEEVKSARLQRPFITIAGILGPVGQALEEARIASDLGYHMALLSNGSLANLTEAQLIDRVHKVAEVIPVFGFYLQPAVGGRVLSFDFWKDFAEIPNVHAIKVAAFNRYQTLDVVRAVCSSSRAADIALYTGNDDNIVGDLITPYRFNIGGRNIEKKFIGGLLGHWAFWTSKAVSLLTRIKSSGNHELADLLADGIHITDVNAAVFDPAHDFKGCISGINEVLRQQGLLGNNLCLSDHESLSSGQLDEIARVHNAYPHLHDDDFIQSNLNKWLS